MEAYTSKYDSRGTFIQEVHMEWVARHLQLSPVTGGFDIISVSIFLIILFRIVLNFSKFYIIFKTLINRAGKITQWLRTLDGLPEDPGFDPSTYTAANNHLLLQLQGIYCLHLSSVGTIRYGIHTSRQNCHAHKNK